MLAGMEGEARRVAASLQVYIPESRLRLPLAAEGAEAHAALELHVLIRFGQFQEILSWPAKEDTALYCVPLAIGIPAQEPLLGPKKLTLLVQNVEFTV
jgi:hypothetical protein